MGLAAAAQLVFAGTTGTATNIGLLLTQLRYTRVAEREADAHAMRTLKNAGISPKGFGDFFERLEPKTANPPAKSDEEKKAEEKKKVSLGSRIFTSEILRTHPATGDRLALVRAQPAYAATPALSDDDWRALREMCGSVTIAPRPATPSAAERPSTANPGPAKTTPAPPPRPTGPPAQQASDADRDIAEATKALEANPEDVAALQRRARAHSRKNQHAEAAGRLHQGRAAETGRRQPADRPGRSALQPAPVRAGAGRLRRGDPARRQQRGRPQQPRQHQSRAQALPGGAHRFRRPHQDPPELRVRLLQSRPDQRRHGPGRGRDARFHRRHSASTRTTPVPTRSAACCTRRPARASRPSPISGPRSPLRLPNTRAAPGRSAWRASA